MKVKWVNQVGLKMLPDEAREIINDIEKVLRNFQSGDYYPLALHDFAEELKEGMDE